MIGWLKKAFRAADVRPYVKPTGSEAPKPGQMALPPTVKAANEAINALPEKAKLNLGSARPSESRGTFDAPAFFAVLRQGPLRHSKPGQVAGTETILRAMHGMPLSWVAYALATTWHETAFTMQPIKEKGGRAYFMQMYDKSGTRPKVAADLGNTVVGDGATFAGRGYVQLTGRRNYTKASAKLGVDLVRTPDLAMQPDNAARILREGMKDGWFTGRGFVAFLPSNGPASMAQFTQARRIINGLDKAGKIAGEALAFQAALIGGNWRD